MPGREDTNSGQLHGALGMGVLKMLVAKPPHGSPFALRIEQLAADVPTVEEGMPYTALYRMEQRGWLASEWATIGTGAVLQAHQGRSRAAGGRDRELERSDSVQGVMNA